MYASSQPVGVALDTTVAKDATVAKFAPYAYAGALAAAASFTPVVKTIVTTAFISGEQVLSVLSGAFVVMSGADLPVNSCGYIGAFYCDGVIKYKNIDGISRNLSLLGVTLS